ncbi:MAG TPA: sensor histidine kinase [Nitrospira sp.]|nr:sensor histidine kinase [Nitrospira sp.]HNP42042.1 sensor histidine kinase [Nitrospira sp.]
MKYVFKATDIMNLVFTFVAIVTALALFRVSERAKITTLAFLPLAAGFIAILLRNMNVIPNFPLINQAVMLGFILEVAVFTFGFLFWHNRLENEREMLEMKLRVEQQEKQLAIQTAEQKVKDRIARDLHDDIAASMSGIRILSQVARQSVGNLSGNTAEILEQINSSAQNTLEGISDLIWAVKPNPDYLNDIADRMRAYAIKVFEAGDIQYKFDIARDLPILELDLETRRNLYLIFKEAVNNALKYSTCKNIRISMKVDNRMLRLIIEDDGKGFDPAAAQNSGNGLGNMALRAEDIGANFELLSAPGRGTRVEVSLPLLQDLK